jgi:hypothetical protein
MSNAQLLYLEMHIEKKLDRDKHCLSRCLAHTNLWFRLRPLAADAKNKILNSGKALSLANKEATSWIEKGTGRRMENFEDQVSDRFSALALKAVSEQIPAATASCESKGSDL